MEPAVLGITNYLYRSVHVYHWFTGINRTDNGFIIPLISSVYNNTVMSPYKYRQIPNVLCKLIY